ncbi:MAG: DUF1559 domain-containing protein, partial [Planctomycetaceae bacterium]|nr:DUF1559 domain-containing protein [Planctomycetaceae bacterium]
NSEKVTNQGDSYIWNIPNTITSGDGGANNPLAISIASLYCPSNGVTSSKPNDHTAGSNYKFIVGDSPGDGTLLNGASYRGAVGKGQYIDMSAVTDGTSNTLVFGERAMILCRQASRKVKTTFPNTTSSAIWNAGSSTVASTLKSRKAIYDLAANGEYLAASPITMGQYGSNFGWNYAGGPQWGCLTTIMPPNAPGCYYGAVTWTSVVPLTSFHTSGVNACLLDGSVRFVSETVDAGTADTYPAGQINSQGAVTGPSPFGVWGAAGSRDGGEAVSLP